MRLFIFIATFAALSACAPARLAGDMAIGAGQLTLGAADLLI